jgi:hypothetical protein
VDPSLKASILEFLRRPGFRESDIMLHFKGLIEDVLKRNVAYLSTNPPVVVIDALDECGSDDTHSAQRRILLETITLWSHLPHAFKLVVTSRNERLPSSFHDPHVCRHIALETGDSVGRETQNDIRAYFERRFDEIKETLGMPFSWPGKQAIEQLTKRAAGLYIWASTAMKFMAQEWEDPSTKLNLVLAGNFGEMNENIDVLYRDVLAFAFKKADDSTLDLFRLLVGAIIVAKVPLHRDGIENFLAPHIDGAGWRLNIIFQRLPSVIEVDNSGLLHLRHLSFAEFLSDVNRCGGRRFYINTDEHHSKMAMASLLEMNRSLRFNICNLESSHVRNEDVPNLKERIQSSIPSRLAYSCRFWGFHLCATAYNFNRDLLKQIQAFLYVKLLNWLEVMSLIKKIPASSIALLTSSRRIEVRITSTTFYTVFNVTS